MEIIRITQSDIQTDETTNPLFESMPAAGFAHLIESEEKDALNLHEHLVKNPTATFFVNVDGDSMRDAGIFSGDILVIDRSLDARDGSIVLAILNNEFTVKRLKKKNGKVTLAAENPDYPDVVVTEEIDFSIWGVVTSAIHKLT